MLSQGTPGAEVLSFYDPKASHIADRGLKIDPEQPSTIEKLVALKDPFKIVAATLPTAFPLQKPGSHPANSGSVCPLSRKSCLADADAGP
jgi:hypothetical protein